MNFLQQRRLSTYRLVLPPEGEVAEYTKVLVSKERDPIRQHVSAHCSETVALDAQTAMIAARKHSGDIANFFCS